jgi:hypothetical protein
MIEIEALDSDQLLEMTIIWNLKLQRVELGDIIVVISNDLENGDPFFVVFCNKPSHMCE